jgi:hypothetical protein
MKNVDISQRAENCSETDLFRLLQLSAANKIPLVLCERLGSSSSALPDSVRAFCRAQLKRQEAHAVISQQLAELASEAHLDLLFIKTVRPYPYAGSDIDVILSSNSEFRSFVEMLGARGYRILAKSDREVTFETELNGELCLIDVHNDISAAGMVYFDKRLLWENKVKVDVRGHDVHIPSPEAELVLLAAHATLKELTVTLADFLHAVHLTKQVDWEKVSAIVHNQDLAVAFSAFASAVNAMNALLYHTRLEPSPLHNATLPSRRTRIDDMVSWDFNRKLSAPYHYSLIIIAIAYLDKFRRNPKELFNASMSRHALTLLSRHFQGNGG